MRPRDLLRLVVAAAAAGTALAPAAPSEAQAKEQFVPVNFYWVGPYAASGSGIAAGMLDYLRMLNARDGGVNGVKFTWAKCDTEYRTERGIECYERVKDHPPTGATLIHPLSTAITYSGKVSGGSMSGSYKVDDGQQSTGPWSASKSS